ncbi:uncharacterized protein [Callorhinus ursinus]|uniref:Glutaredoxin-1 isoform X1 n=1 Tax=Callorhinus ursinus TaxID=34884 RepID=A0A3Q7NLV1_CALUR|nr:glutaredoxin-1 isoform X1 [Callorhinus ursinus]
MPQRSQLLQSWAPLLCKMVVQPPSSYQQRVKAQHLSGNVTRLDPSASATCGTKNGNVISTGQAKYRDQRICSGNEEPTTPGKSENSAGSCGHEDCPLASRMQPPCVARADSDCLEPATCLEDATRKPSHWMTGECHRAQGKKRVDYGLPPKRAECGYSLRQTKCTLTRKELCFFPQPRKPEAGRTAGGDKCGSGPLLRTTYPTQVWPNG